MAFKSTAVVLSTTPLLIAGNGSTVIDTSDASLADPVYVWLENLSAISVFLTGSSAAPGAAPAMFLLTTGAADPRTRVGPFRLFPSDNIFAFSTAAGTTVGVIGTRQQGS